MVAAVALSNFFGQLVFSILLVYAVRELGLSAATIGLAIAAGNAGPLLAALTAKRISARLGVGRTIVGASFLFGPGALLIAAAPHDNAVPFIVAAMIVMGFGGVLYNVTAISLIQAITPDRMLGRANASRRFIVWGVIPLGGLVGGVLGTWIGLRPTILVGALGGLLAVIPLVLSPVRSLVRVPDSDHPDAIASASSA